MEYSAYTNKSPEELSKEFSVDLNKGLSKAEAEKRLLSYGPNKISGREVNGWQILKRQFTSPFIWLLLGAVGLAFILREFIDGGMILLFVAINTFLGFIQEYHSENAVKLLKRYMVHRLRTLRDGREETVESASLVPGDIILVKPGDILPADLRFFAAYDLMVDESVLTGESAPAKKSAETEKEKSNAIFAATNIGFSGTHIMTGEGKGIIFATGAKTEIGRIAKMTGETIHIGAFEKNLAKFSTFILRLISITLVAVFLANLFIKGLSDLAELVIFSIALAISVIPEALPVVTTFSLSRGALRLAKNKVVVKRLAAIEDLGSVEILCTDKTGTLTENKLTVDQVYAFQDRPALWLANLAAPNIKDDDEPGDAFDQALIGHLPAEEKINIKQYGQIEEIPFDPERRRNSVIVQKDKEFILISRGAAEEIIKLCPKISPAEKEKLTAWHVSAGRAGRRVIAVASRKLTAKNKDILAGENNLDFAGLISFIDPVKKSTKDAVNKAESLGVKIKILTGDSPEVAGAVAQQIALTDDITAVITGENFQKLSHEEQHKATEKYAVFARVTPEQKFNIIHILQEKYEVGFLGEGINDAPALKISNVGLVVESASDIARETADIVLLNKSLKVIIDGVEEGRRVFANTLKYIKATLTSNFGNFFAVAIASLLIDYLPMLPLQILLLNLLSDFPMIAIATDNVDLAELKKPRHYKIKDVALMAITLGVISTVFDFIFFGLFYRISPATLQTNWFIGSVITELLLIFSIRTRYFFLKGKKLSPTLLWLSVAAIGITILLPFTFIGRDLFKFTAPTYTQLLTISLVAITYFIFTESGKLLYYRFVKENNNK
ncbi:MAG: HAD-IC family P-type ATPase [Patescibacteria group bacterium]